MQKKIWLIFTVIIIIAFGLTFGGTARNVRNYYLTFLRVAQTNHEDFWGKIKQADQEKNRLASKDNYLVLILGTDSLEYRPGDPVMTDTMILANIKMLENEAPKLSLLPIPRDIYIKSEQIKINGLYNKALENGSTTPERSVAEYMGNWIGAPIDSTFVFSLAQVSDLIDLIGGVEIEIDNDFTDELYPKAGIDVTVEHDPKVLYETVKFHKGKEKMSGERALIYMRSRHALGDEGSDIARSIRQQKVIRAFMMQGAAAIMDSRTMLNFVLLGDLYRYYLDNYERYLPISTALGLVLRAGVLEIGVGKDVVKLPEIKMNQLGIVGVDENAVLKEPSKEEMAKDFGGAWAWEIVDEQLLLSEIRLKLAL